MPVTDRYRPWLHKRHPCLPRWAGAAAVLLVLGWSVLPLRLELSDLAIVRLVLRGHAALASPSLVNEVSPQFLGNPFTDQPLLSKNVWDMQAFGGRIYLGNGDYGLNTGPIPIRYFDPSLQQFLVDPVL